MVDQFTRRLTYPSGYPGRLAETQSAVPSQDAPIERPYSSSKGQVDIAVSQQFSPPVPQAVIVRAGFDSRPQFAYDWFWEEKFVNNVSQNPAGSTPYTVPKGYNLFLRKITLSLFANATDATQAWLNVHGDHDIPFASIALLNIIVDNTPTPFFTQSGNVGLIGTPLWDIYMSDIEIDTFVVIGGGSTLIVNCRVPSLVPNGPVGNVYAHYYGNMLLSRNRPVTSEVGNFDALPVIESSLGNSQ